MRDQKSQTEMMARDNPEAPTSVDIELLALDLNSCTRCTGSLASVEAAIALTEPVLGAAGIETRFQNRVIETEEQARRHHLYASPTIRIGGLDIAPDVHESHCESCTDLCGCAEGTNCREWHYRGQIYNEAPVGMVVEAIMRAAFGQSTSEHSATGEDIVHVAVPDNLKRFFEEKSSCCGTGGAQACGC